jgi:hypothetical protein
MHILATRPPVVYFIVAVSFFHMLGQMEERILIAAKVVKLYGWVASQNAW